MSKFLHNLAGLTCIYGVIAAMVITGLSAIAISILYSPWYGVPLVVLVPVIAATGMTLLDKIMESR